MKICVLQPTIIYKATNMVNGKIYIGLTNNLEKRIKRHLTIKNKTYFQRALYKYNKFFAWDILNKDIERNYAKKLEKFWIKYFKDLGYELYNLTDGGDGNKGLKYTNEQKIKLSEKRKGINNSFYGKHHTKEKKEYWAKIRRGQFNGEKHPCCKLKEKDVIFIRKNYMKYKQRELAKIFNINRAHISSIINYRTWRYLCV